MKLKKNKMKSSFFLKFYLGLVVVILFSLLIFIFSSIVLVTRQWWNEKMDMLETNCQEIAYDYVEALCTSEENSTDRTMNIIVLGNDMEAFSSATGADYFVTDTKGDIIICRHFFDNGGKVCDEHRQVKIRDQLVEKVSSSYVNELTGISDDEPANSFVVGLPIINNGAVVAQVYGTIDAVNGLLPYVASLSKMIFFAAILTILIAFVIIYLYSRSYTKPMVKMIEATNHYAKSDFSYHIDIEDLDGQMKDMAQALNRMADEIAIYDSSQKSFVANVSHELKTPMTTIGGFVDGILDGTIPKEKENEYLLKVSSEVKRLARLVVAMLNLSKIESGEVKINPTKYSLQSQIFETLFSMEQKINEKNIGINGLEDIADIKIKGDKDLLHQVVYNLIDNAVKFTPDEGEISFFAKDNKNETEVTIRNSGTGVSQGEISRIFERFYKVDKSRSFDVKGVGLGLYIVKTIINMHGGSITASSKEGEYTQFTFTIPN